KVAGDHHGPEERESSCNIISSRISSLLRAFREEAADLVLRLFYEELPAVLVQSSPKEQYYLKFPWQMD
ncbi:unnamed protein product, partial [Amoebophrya sp. A25]